MEKEKLFLSSQAIELAETDNYIELVNRLCYYGEPNLNNVILPVEDAAEKAETLVNQPVVAKYKIINGKDDLGGHEAYREKKTGKTKFRTENIGTHVSVEVKDDIINIDGKQKKVPCLFATSRIWKRNENVVNAIKRLFKEKKLCSSWEISSLSYVFQNGIKTLTDYFFEANCLLGSTQTPAYPCANALSLSTMEDSQIMIAEAMAIDFANNDPQQEESMIIENTTVATEEDVATSVNTSTDQPQTSSIEQTVDNSTCKTDDKKADADNAKCGDDTEDKKVTDVNSKCGDKTKKSTAEKSTEDSELTKNVSDISASETDISSFTVDDLYSKISSALKNKYSREFYWYYVSMIFPEEHIVLARIQSYDNAPKVFKLTELQYMKYVYAIDDKDEVTLDDGELIELKISPLAVNSTIEQYNSTIVEATNKISNLEIEISELKPFKEAAEKAEKDAKIAEISEYAKKSNLIADTEISDVNSDVYKAIESLDMSSIKQIIADRFMSKATNQTTVKTESKTEISTNISDTPDEVSIETNPIKIYIQSNAKRR